MILLDNVSDLSFCELCRFRLFFSVVTGLAVAGVQSLSRLVIHDTSSLELEEQWDIVSRCGGQEGEGDQMAYLSPRRKGKRKSRSGPSL